MSETPQERIEKWLAEGRWVKEADEPERGIREAIQAVLDLVRVQYEANEEMTRLLRQAEVLGDQAEQELEQAEVERDALRAEIARRDHVAHVNASWRPDR